MLQLAQYVGVALMVCLPPANPTLYDKACDWKVARSPVNGERIVVSTEYACYDARRKYYPDLPRSRYRCDHVPVRVHNRG